MNEFRQTVRESIDWSECPYAACVVRKYQLIAEFSGMGAVMDTAQDAVSSGLPLVLFDLVSDAIVRTGGGQASMFPEVQVHRLFAIYVVTLEGAFALGGLLKREGFLVDEFGVAYEVLEMLRTVAGQEMRDFEWHADALRKSFGVMQSVHRELMKIEHAHRDMLVGYLAAVDFTGALGLPRTEGEARASLADCLSEYTRMIESQGGVAEGRSS